MGFDSRQFKSLALNSLRNHPPSGQWKLRISVTDVFIIKFVVFGIRRSICLLTSKLESLHFVDPKIGNAQCLLSFPQLCPKQTPTMRTASVGKVHWVPPFSLGMTSFTRLHAELVKRNGGYQWIKVEIPCSISSFFLAGSVASAAVASGGLGPAEQLDHPAPQKQQQMHLQLCFGPSQPSFGLEFCESPSATQVMEPLREICSIHRSIPHSSQGRFRSKWMGDTGTAPTLRAVLATENSARGPENFPFQSWVVLMGILIFHGLL